MLSEGQAYNLAVDLYNIVWGGQTLGCMAELAVFATLNIHACMVYIPSSFLHTHWLKNQKPCVFYGFGIHGLVLWLPFMLTKKVKVKIKFSLCF